MRGGPNSAYPLGLTPSNLTLFPYGNPSNVGHDYHVLPN